MRSALLKAVSALRAGGAALWSQPVVRRRTAIIVAAVFVWSYALGVLTYVLLTPEIGLRCAFTPVVNHFDKHFLYPRGQEPLRDGDRIVELGNQRIANWSQLMRKLIEVNDEPATPV